MFRVKFFGGEVKNLVVVSIIDCWGSQIYVWRVENNVLKILSGEWVC